MRSPLRPLTLAVALAGSASRRPGAQRAAGKRGHGQQRCCSTPGSVLSGWGRRAGWVGRAAKPAQICCCAGGGCAGGTAGARAWLQPVAGLTGECPSLQPIGCIKRSLRPQQLRISRRPAVQGECTVVHWSRRRRFKIIRRLGRLCAGPTGAVQLHSSPDAMSEGRLAGTPDQCNSAPRRRRKVMVPHRRQRSCHA